MTEREHRLPVIIITGNATVDNAILALKKRVVDFIRKPIDFDELFRICSPYLSEESDSTSVSSGTILTVNSELQEVLTNARKIACSELPVLITGESGTGKELLADYIHHESARRDRTMYKLNCASLPESLLESELFGYRRGAFTGAAEETRGIFEQSDGSTLFLDEIGDMPVGQQARILRVLQNGEIRPIGGTKIVSVDVRFVAATNLNLDDALESRVFREDLLYRLNAGHLHIPSLRHRPEDILPLAELFVRTRAAKGGGPIKPFDGEVKRVLVSYSWPGNVRELKNSIDYAYVVSGDHNITVSDLPASVVPGGVSVGETRRLSQGVSIDEAERELIIRTLFETGNNKKETARILSISRSTLYEKIRKYGVTDVV